MHFTYPGEHFGCKKPQDVLSVIANSRERSLNTEAMNLLLYYITTEKIIFNIGQNVWGLLHQELWIFLPLLTTRTNFQSPDINLKFFILPVWYLFQFMLYFSLKVNNPGLSQKLTSRVDNHSETCQSWCVLASTWYCRLTVVWSRLLHDVFVMVFMEGTMIIAWSSWKKAMIALCWLWSIS